MKLVLAVLICLPALAGDATLVFDRGLPQANLNNISGDARSNVRWSGDNGGFFGDDFSIGAPGERWVVDSIRVWTVPGITETGAKRLGDIYQDMALQMPPANPGGLTPVSYASIIAYWLRESGFPAGGPGLPGDSRQLGAIRIDATGSTQP